MRTITKQTVNSSAKKFNGKQRIARLGGGFCVLLGALLCCPSNVQGAVGRVTWNRSTSSEVVGYRIYYGIASGSYTNSVTVGNVTNYTISNLMNGVTYFFASKAYNASGVESIFSNEALFTPDGSATLQLTIAPNRRAILTLTGKSGHRYEIQGSSNLTSWSTLGTVTLGSGTTTNFTDVNAPSYSKRYYRTRDTTP